MNARRIATAAAVLTLAAGCSLPITSPFGASPSDSDQRQAPPDGTDIDATFAPQPTSAQPPAHDGDVVSGSLDVRIADQVTSVALIDPLSDSGAQAAELDSDGTWTADAPDRPITYLNAYDDAGGIVALGVIVDGIGPVALGPSSHALALPFTAIARVANDHPDLYADVHQFLQGTDEVAVLEHAYVVHVLDQGQEAMRLPFTEEVFVAEVLDRVKRQLADRHDDLAALAP